MPIAKAALRDTPPVDVIYRGRSPGLRVIAQVRLPEAGLSDLDGLSLAAYSCGGSFGFRLRSKPLPNSLLAADFHPQNLDDEAMYHVADAVKERMMAACTRLVTGRSADGVYERFLDVKGRRKIMNVAHDSMR